MNAALRSRLGWGVAFGKRSEVSGLRGAELSSIGEAPYGERGETRELSGSALVERHAIARRERQQNRVGVAEGGEVDILSAQGPRERVCERDHVDAVVTENADVYVVGAVAPRAAEPKRTTRQRPSRSAISPAT